MLLVVYRKEEQIIGENIDVCRPTSDAIVTECSVFRVEKCAVRICLKRMMLRSAFYAKDSGKPGDIRRLSPCSALGA